MGGDAAPSGERAGFELIGTAVEREEPVEIRRHRLRVVLPVLIRPRLQSDERRDHPMMIVDEVRLHFQQLIELRLRQQPMNVELPEPAGIRMPEVIEDQLR